MKTLTGNISFSEQQDKEMSKVFAQNMEYANQQALEKFSRNTRYGVFTDILKSQIDNGADKLNGSRNRTNRGKSVFENEYSDLTKQKFSFVIQSQLQEQLMEIEDIDEGY